MNRVHCFGFGLLLCVATVVASPSLAQSTAPGGVPDLSPLPQGEGRVGGATAGAVSSFSGQKVRPLTEGPLHEAFLSPRKDRNPKRVEQAPPPPLSERPGIEPPSASAEWIEGYWEWDTSRNDFVWVTGTWRVAPPGRFWVNGYWKRDDKGWFRVPGFWSERKTDRLDYRKDGPPHDHPDDEPGDPPNADCFFIPGQYYPDGDGVVWKKGYWTKAQPGWSWVPAQWVRQPDGWVFQEGYWDRTLEDRGILFTPAEVDKGARGTDDLTYQPYSKVAPEMYGQLNGAFGRPNSNYDGYPGVYYDDSGRYYGYGSYGYLNGYYGYLDYPYYGGNGYPYNTTPVQNGMGGGYGYGDPYGGYGGIRRVWRRRLWRWRVRRLWTLRRPDGRRIRLWARRPRLWRIRLWLSVRVRLSLWLRRPWTRLRRIRLRRIWRFRIRFSGLWLWVRVSRIRLWVRFRLSVFRLRVWLGRLGLGWLGRVGSRRLGRLGKRRLGSRRVCESEFFGKPKREHHPNHQRDTKREHRDPQYND